MFSGSAQASGTSEEVAECTLLMNSSGSSSLVSHSVNKGPLVFEQTDDDNVSLGLEFLLNLSLRKVMVKPTGRREDFNQRTCGDIYSTIVLFIV